MKVNTFSPNRLVVAVLILVGMTCLLPGRAEAVTVTPSAWNIIGLDSNRPASGPNRFPVGARVCGGTPGATVNATNIF